MKRSQKKLSLNRDTIMTLSDPRLQQAAGGMLVPPTVGCTARVSCGGTCDGCLTRTCVICGTQTTNLC